MEIFYIAQNIDALRHNQNNWGVLIKLKNVPAVLKWRMEYVIVRVSEKGEFYKDGTNLRWREVDFEKNVMGQFTKKHYIRYFGTMRALNDAAVYDYENC